MIDFPHHLSAGLALLGPSMGRVYVQEPTRDDPDHCHVVVERRTRPEPETAEALGHLGWLHTRYANPARWEYQFCLHYERGL